MGGTFAGKDQDSTAGIYALAGMTCCETFVYMCCACLLNVFIYRTSHTKFERNHFSSSRDIWVPETRKIFFVFFFFTPNDICA